MKKLLLLSLTLVFINNYSNAQLLSIPLKISDEFAIDTLYFGIDPTASNGLDNLLGEDELPPLPPTGVFDARFTGEGLVPSVPLGEGSKKDFRFGANSIDTIHKYRLKYKVGIGSSILISWKNVPNSVEARIKDLFDGFFINKLILSTDSLLITNHTGLSTLELTVHYLRTDPVELSSFTSFIYLNNVILNWVTTMESQNKGFGIERKKIDTQNWFQIGFVTGNVNSNENNYYSFTDQNLNQGKYNYRLKQTDLNGNYEYFNLTEIVEIGLPEKFYLSQNYPNPFNPATTINYNLPLDSYVKLTLFDMNGKYIKSISEGFQSSGYYEVNFNSNGISSGTYYYRLETNDQTITKKMLIIK